MDLEGIRRDPAMGTGHVSLDTLAKIHDHPLVLQTNDGAVLLVALRETNHQLGPRIVVELLEPQGNPLVVRIDVKNHHVQFVALLHDLGGMLHALGPTHVRDVDQSVDPRLDLDERAEGSEVPHDSREACAGGVLQRQREPRILFDLLHPERDLLLVRIDLQHHGLDLVTDRHELGRMPDVARPRHLRDVDQSFDALLQLDEGPVVGDRHDPSLDSGTDGIPLLDVRPGVGQQLLETEGDPLAVPIDVEHLHIEIASNIDDFGGMTHASPGHVGDVQESVEPAEVDEGSEVGDILDDALADLPLEQLLDQSRPLLLALALQDHPARHHDVPAPLVELDDLEVVALADQLLDVGHAAQRDLRAGEERVHAHDVDGYAALDLAGQKSLDRLVLFVGVLDQLPYPQEVRLLLGKDDHSIVVLQALEEDLDFLAGNDGITVLELVEGYGPLTLEAEFEDGRGVRRTQDPGLDDLAFLDDAACRLVVGEHGVEVVVRDVEHLFAVGVVQQFRGDVVGLQLLGRGWPVVGADRLGDRESFWCVVHCQCLADSGPALRCWSSQEKALRARLELNGFARSRANPFMAADRLCLFVPRLMLTTRNPAD